MQGTVVKQRGGRVTNTDITELLESYVDLLEKGGIPRESTESKIMLEAAKEIKKLREQLDFQRKLADENNKSRLRYQDVVIKGMELYEETCKNVREQNGDDSVCGMCIDDCNHGLDGYANECKGFYQDDCFRLNVNKYNDIVFRKDEE
nr:MAG TPA: hypothetical protein [Caudoviricetes sp.]